MLQKIFIMSMFLLSSNLFSKTHKLKAFNKYKSQSMTFNPSFLKIAKGDKISFIPTAKDHNFQSVFVPKNAKPWKTKPGKKETIEFLEEGVYIYECVNHSIMSMNGVIQVGNSVNKKDAENFLKKYKKKVVIKKNRIDSAFGQVK